MDKILGIKIMTEVLKSLYSDNDVEQRLFLAISDLVSITPEEVSVEHYAEVQSLIEEYGESSKLVVDPTGNLSDSVVDKTALAEKLKTLAEKVIAFNGEGE